MHALRIAAGAFHETLLVDDAERVRSFVPFFRTFAAHRIFPSATRARRDHLVVISGEIEKG